MDGPETKRTGETPNLGTCSLIAFRVLFFFVFVCSLLFFFCLAVAPFDFLLFVTGSGACGLLCAFHYDDYVTFVSLWNE